MSSIEDRVVIRMPSPERECTATFTDCKWSPLLFIPLKESLKEYVKEVGEVIDSGMERYEISPTPMLRIQIQNAFRKMEMASKQVQECENAIEMAELP